MSLSKFANIAEAKQHAEQLRKSLKTSADVAALNALETELVHAGTGYVIAPIPVLHRLLEPVAPAVAPVAKVVASVAPAAKPAKAPAAKAAKPAIQRVVLDDAPAADVLGFDAPAKD